MCEYRHYELVGLYRRCCRYRVFPAPFYNTRHRSSFYCSRFDYAGVYLAINELGQNMEIDIKDLDYDETPMYCAKCGELVILHKDGERSCCCTRNGDQLAVLDWKIRD